MDGNNDMPDVHLTMISDRIDSIVSLYKLVPRMTNEQYQNVIKNVEMDAKEAKSIAADIIADRDRLRELVIRPKHIEQATTNTEPKPLLFYPPITMK